MNPNDKLKAKSNDKIITLIKSRVIEGKILGGRIEWLVENEDEVRYWFLESVIESCYTPVPKLVKEWFQALSSDGKINTTAGTIAEAVSNARSLYVKIIRYQKFSDGLATYDFVDHDGNVL